MPVTQIDPNLRESQSSQRKKANTAQDFADFMGTVGASAAPQAAEVGNRGSGAVTSAAVSGMVGATNAYTNPLGGYGGNAPYYSSSTASIASVGVPTNLSTATYAPGSGQFSWTSPGGGVGVGNTIPGGAGGVTQDTLYREQLFREMNDANWEMLVAQVTVNNLSRDYQARSNLLKTKADTEVSIARNFRA